MSAEKLVEEIKARVAAAHASVKNAESQVELALRDVEMAERADKKIISTALRAAFDELAAARRELEAALSA